MSGFNDFPKQDEPLYAFKVEKSGKLVRTKIPNYSTYSNRRGVTSYRFSLGLRHVVKTDEQLDRYLSGYVYSKDPDKDHAAAITAHTLWDKIQEMEKTLHNARALYDHVTTQMEIPDEEDEA